MLLLCREEKTVSDYVVEKVSIHKFGMTVRLGSYALILNGRQEWLQVNFWMYYLMLRAINKMNILYIAHFLQIGRLFLWNRFEHYSHG